MKYQTMLLCFLTVFFGTALHGQDAAAAAKPITADEAISILKNGTLVVRLSTNARKIEALEKMATNSAKEKDRQRFGEMLEKTRQDTRNHNLWLMEAFRVNYNFSKLLFMPDTAATMLKHGIKEGIFLGPDLQIDDSLTLEGGYLVAFNGANTSDEKTNNEGINVIDHNLQSLRHPFPFFTGRTSIRRMFEEVFNRSTALGHYTQLVIKFQQKLLEFGK